MLPLIAYVLLVAVIAALPLGHWTRIHPTRRPRKDQP